MHNRDSSLETQNCDGAFKISSQNKERYDSAITFCQLGPSATDNHNCKVPTWTSKLREHKFNDSMIEWYAANSKFNDY